MEQPQLGLKISELRKQKGFTQEELVEQCNINVRTLQRIESGEVSPRSYTIKTILSALDYDYESLQEIDKNKYSKLSLVAPKEAKSIQTLLIVSLVAGILFLIAGVFEGVGDYVRFDDNELIYGKWGHFTIKILVLVFNTLFMYGFLIAGKLLKNYLMKIASVLIIIGLLAFCTYDIISIFYKTFNFEVVILAEAIGFGALGILFGVSILKSKNILGNTGLISGTMELLMSLCLLTVILSPIALFLFFPVVILEILVLYKVSSLI